MKHGLSSYHYTQYESMVSLQFCRVWVTKSRPVRFSTSCVLFSNSLANSLFSASISYLALVCCSYTQLHTTSTILWWICWFHQSHIKKKVYCCMKIFFYRNVWKTTLLQSKQMLPETDRNNALFLVIHLIYQLQNNQVSSGKMIIKMKNIYSLNSRVLFWTILISPVVVVCLQDFLPQFLSECWALQLHRHTMTHSWHSGQDTRTATH